MKKPSLSKALKLAESVAGLARALHVSASTVRRWKEKVSDAGAEKLTRFLARQEKLGERRKADRNRIHELMKLADVEGKLPSIRTGTRARAGRLTVGVQHVKNFKLMLSYDVLDDIDVWLRSLKKRFNMWQLLAIISQYGVGEHRGYKTVYYQLAPDAGDFAISANVATPAMTSLRQAESVLREKLEAVIEGSKVIAFLHSVTAFNYNKRTPEESSAWETMQRQIREEKARKWRKKQEQKAPPPSTTKKPKAKKSSKHSEAPKTGWKSHPTSLPSSPSSQPSKTTGSARSSKRAQRSAPKASKASTKKSKPFSQPSSKKTPTRARSKLTSKASAKRSKQASSKKKTTTRKR